MEKQNSDYLLMVALFLGQSENMHTGVRRQSLILSSTTMPTRFLTHVCTASTHSAHLVPPTDHGGHAPIPTASYRILMVHWLLYSFVVGNSFSGCILAFTNVRLYDSAVNTISGLEAALQTESFTAGSLRDSLMTSMIRVGGSRCRSAAC